ncbi:MAG: hypothetical protein J1F17_04855 [Oscillospiraceae bacterium]|nr:hypothetical protein [Oscillospiraceae bacterium]
MKNKNSKSKNVMKNNNIEEPNMIIQYNTQSAYDCTGLIPTEIESEEEIHNYEELYPFLPPVVKPDKEK